MRGACSAALATEWGPVAVWCAALATFLAAVVALVAAIGGFERFRAPELRLTFRPSPPWCRSVGARSRGGVLWVRVGVENVGRQPARGCIGRMTGVVTQGAERTDVDPLHLRWAGVPRSRSFDAVDIRRGQREFLDVLSLRCGSGWRIVTFDDADFRPGFPTELLAGERHLLRVSVSADNARTVVRMLSAELRPADSSVRLEIVDDA
jgi:hypothetical protein